LVGNDEKNGVEFFDFSHLGSITPARDDAADGNAKCLGGATLVPTGVP
jgi:hypothetical protein